MINNKTLGDFGETIAAEYLKLDGYQIKERNFRCHMGEVDIIAEKKDEIVFIEVKTRSSNAFGNPSEAVDENKLAHIQKTGAFYLLSHGLKNVTVRFDVMEVGLNHIPCVI